jgi:drug/metabolite transporter (DMT)-like permease
MAPPLGPEGLSMSDEFREDRRPRRHRERGWIAALILIGIGVVLLLQNFGFTVPHNWWALFLLIPAVVAFANAFATYNREGRLTTAAIGPFVGGVVLVALTIVFLLELTINWDLIGPIALILIGLGILARHYQRL